MISNQSFSLIGGDMHGLRTMPVVVTDVLRITWPMMTDVGASLTPPISTGLRPSADKCDLGISES